MDLELTAKRALVTGGSSGIGKAIARELAREGADVTIVARDRARLERTAHELSTDIGGSVSFATVDTGEAASITSMAAEVIDRCGGIDILVNCAARPSGSTAIQRWNEITEEALFEEIRVKVLGYLRVAQAAAPSMIASGWGRIINISGVAARQTGTTVGSIRNISVAALSKNLADELAPHGIGVVTLHPGATRTESTPAAVAERPAGNLVGRMIEASEVAYVAAFVASPKSVAIDGESITIGGGTPRAIYY